MSLSFGKHGNTWGGLVAMFLLREVLSLIHLAHFLPRFHHIFHVTLHWKKTVFFGKATGGRKENLLADINLKPLGSINFMLAGLGRSECEPHPSAPTSSSSLNSSSLNSVLHVIGVTISEVPINPPNTTRKYGNHNYIHWVLSKRCISA